MKDKYGDYLIFFLALLMVRNAAGSCMGCVELDEFTFEKILSKFRYSLLKFDIAFPYGEKHEAFGEFSKTIGAKVDDLLVGLVGVKDYGDKENSDLAKRYQVDEKKYPVILLFKNYSSEDYDRYPSESPITTENIKKFIKEHTDLYIGLDGCLREFDALVTGFVSKNEDEQLRVIEAAGKIRDSLEKDEDKVKATVYMAIMKRIMERGVNFIADEQRRLEGLLQSKISENKKQELTRRLNILLSFQSRLESSHAQDEL